MEDILNSNKQYAGTPVIIISLLVVIITVILWIFLGKLKKRILRKEGITKSDKSTILSVIFYIIRVLLVSFVVLFILQINGINVTSLIAGLGVFGAVLGIAGKDLVTDIIMGYHIVTDKFFGVGDCVKYGEYEGVITDFNLKATKLKTFDEKAVVTVCNRNISEIKKLSGLMYLEIPMPYPVSGEKSRETVMKISERVAGLDGVMSCKYLGIKEFAASSVTHLLLVETAPEDSYKKHREANGTVFEVLAENGIAIPFNQLDVHIDKL